MASTAKSNGAANAKTKPVADARDDVSEQIATLKSDVAGLIESVSALASAGATAAKGSAAEKAVEAKVKAGAVREVASQKAIETGARAAYYVREKPLVALATAAGIGLVIGLATAPRK